MDLILLISYIFNFLLNFLSSYSIILLTLLFILLVHLILIIVRDQKYIKPFKLYKDPDTVSLEDLNEIPLINILMPAWKEGELFKQALESITKLKYPKLKVIVNAGGDKRTIDIANSFKKYENFVILFQKQGEGKIKAINNCLQYVSEGVIYSVDADVHVTDDVICRLLYPITNLNESISTAGHRPLKSQENKDFAKYLMINHNLSFRLQFERYGTTGISGTNTIMTLDAIKAIGKFKEDRMIATDRSRGLDFINVGLKIFVNIDYRSLIHADIPGTFKEFSRQRVRWIENNLRYSSETKNRKQFLLFFFLFLTSSYLLIFPFLIFIHPTLFLLGLYMIYSKFLKRLRRILFFRRTRHGVFKGQLGIKFYLKIIPFIYLESLINVYTMFDYVLFKKNFLRRRNLLK